MRFGSPWFLLLSLVPLLLLLRWFRHRRAAPHYRIAFPALRFAKGMPPSAREGWHRLPQLLAVGGLALLVLGLARPQVPGKAEPTRVRSRNLMLVLDISSSMKASDFQPGNRLAVAKTVVQEFIHRRDGDLMGLVVFAGKALLQAPLTSDADVLDRLVAQVEIGQLPDGTAIGSALALALNQLKNLQRNACAVVLITDGANNTGEPSPVQAAEAARALGIRIHSIGLSSADTGAVALNGVWSLRTLSGRLTHRDEVALKDIAARTGGQYYRATDPQALQDVISVIDPLERIEVEISETREYHELFPWLVGIGLAMVLTEALLRATWLRTLP